MRIAILGDTEGNEVLERLGFQICSNACPQDGEPVLIAVSAPRGPVAFVETLNRAADVRADHVGMLMTGVGPGDAGELAPISELEARYLLDALEVFPSGVAHRLPCFKTDDAELRDRLVAWAGGPPDPMVFRHAERLD